MKDFAEKYLEILKNDFAGLNLTNLLDIDEFYIKQIQDSILPLEKSSIFKSKICERKLILDVGFGGGFPIIPLAKSFPDCKFIGIEARNKKKLAVSEIASRLGVNNATLHHIRLEDLLIDIPVVITFKAVGKVYEFLEKLNFTSNISVFFYKGPNFLLQESDNFGSLLKKWNLIEDITYTLDNGDERKFLGYEPKNVPRGTLNCSKKLSLL